MILLRAVGDTIPPPPSPPPLVSCILMAMIGWRGFCTPVLSSIFETNDTYPTVVRCQVTCLNQQGFYHPAMALIITRELEQFIMIFPRNISEEGLYKIQFRGISYCEPQNNYTMKFEYLIYANSSKLDRAVLQCGVVHPHINPPCWGRSYGIIQYNAESMSNDSLLITTRLSPPTTSNSGIAFTQHGFLPITIILFCVVVIAFIISAALNFAVGTHYRKLHKRNAALKEQVSVSTVLNVVHSKEEEVRQQNDVELEELPAEEASHNPSTHTKLVIQKLPDMISSHDSKC